MILVHEKNVWSKESFTTEKSLDPKRYVITNIATYLELMLHQHKQYLQIVGELDELVLKVGHRQLQ